MEKVIGYDSILMKLKNKGKTEMYSLMVLEPKYC